MANEMVLEASGITITYAGPHAHAYISGNSLVPMLQLLPMFS